MPGKISFISYEYKKSAKECQNRIDDMVNKIMQFILDIMF